MGDNSHHGERRRSSAIKLLFGHKEEPESLPENKSEVGQSVCVYVYVCVTSYLQGLVFKDICVDVATKRILWSVSGHARPGAVLAILGPLVLARRHCSTLWLVRSRRALAWWSLNGRKLTKKNRRKTSYVLQADVFFPNLTLRETITVSMCTIVLCPIMNLCVCAVFCVAETTTRVQLQRETQQSGGDHQNTSSGGLC